MAEYFEGTHDYPGAKKVRIFLIQIRFLKITRATPAL